MERDERVKCNMGTGGTESEAPNRLERFNELRWLEKQKDETNAFT